MKNLINSTLREYNDHRDVDLDIVNETDKIRAEAEYFVKNKHELKTQCDNDFYENKKNILNSGRLDYPKADQYAQRLTYYKGFLEYPDRLKNYVISAHANYSLIRPYFPTIIDIEPNSRCNFRCKMCHVSSWEKGRRSYDMTLENLKLFISNNNHFTEVKLHGMGEPFLNKKYVEMLQYLDEKIIWSRTTTNGSLLHKRDNYIKLIDANIGEVQCSFDGATKDVFESIRRKSDFETVVSNLKMLNEYANYRDRLYTRMWVVLQKENIDQLYDFVYIAKEMGFKRLSFNSTLNDWGRYDWADSNSEIQIDGLTKENHQKLLEMSEEFDIDISLWEQSGTYSTDSKDKLCPWIFSRPYISSDYKVVPCCMIADPSVINFGDADNFQTQWNSDEYQDFRKAHLDGEIPTICKNCYSSHS